jgi:hypothetical protein
MTPGGGGKTPLEYLAMQTHAPGASVTFPHTFLPRINNAHIRLTVCAGVNGKFGRQSRGRVERKNGQMRAVGRSAVIKDARARRFINFAPIRAAVRATDCVREFARPRRHLHKMSAGLLDDVVSHSFVATLPNVLIV